MGRKNKPVVAKDAVKFSRYVPIEIKRALILEAGEKCGNPGCPTRTIEFHHIDDWAVVHTHDRARMIAICPTCHAACHGGTLRIDAKILFEWKKLRRRVDSKRSMLYVEPDEKHTVVCGSFGVSTTRTAIQILPESSTSSLSYRLVNNDTLCLNAKIFVGADEVLRMELGHVLIPSNDQVIVEQRPGHIRLLLTQSPKTFLPAKLYEFIRESDLFFLSSPRTVTLFEAVVHAPGRVHLQGVWRDSDGDIAVVTNSGLYYYNSSHDTIAPKLVGHARPPSESPGTTLVYTSEDGSLFDMMKSAMADRTRDAAAQTPMLKVLIPRQ